MSVVNQTKVSPPQTRIASLSGSTSPLELNSIRYGIGFGGFGHAACPARRTVLGGGTGGPTGFGPVSLQAARTMHSKTDMTKLYWTKTLPAFSFLMRLYLS